MMLRLINLWMDVLIRRLNRYWQQFCPLETGESDHVLNSSSSPRMVEGMCGWVSGGSRFRLLYGSDVGRL